MPRSAVEHGPPVHPKLGLTGLADTEQPRFPGRRREFGRDKIYGIRRVKAPLSDIEDPHAISPGVEPAHWMEFPRIYGNRGGTVIRKECGAEFRRALGIERPDHSEVLDKSETVEHPFRGGGIADAQRQPSVQYSYTGPQLLVPGDGPVLGEQPFACPNPRGDQFGIAQRIRHPEHAVFDCRRIIEPDRRLNKLFDLTAILSAPEAFCRRQKRVLRRLRKSERVHEGDHDHNRDSRPESPVWHRSHG